MALQDWKKVRGEEIWVNSQREESIMTGRYGDEYNFYINTQWGQIKVVFNKGSYESNKKAALSYAKKYMRSH